MQRFCEEFTTWKAHHLPNVSYRAYYTNIGRRGPFAQAQPFDRCARILFYTSSPHPHLKLYALRETCARFNEQQVAGSVANTILQTHQHQMHTVFPPRCRPSGIDQKPSFSTRVSGSNTLIAMLKPHKKVTKGTAIPTRQRIVSGQGRRRNKREKFSPPQNVSRGPNGWHWLNCSKRDYSQSGI